MKFAMFFIAEYANMISMSALMATLFFGGWDIPFTRWDNEGGHTVLKTVLTLGSFAFKTGFFLFFFMWIRWTLPRFRYDQLMTLGWKILFAVLLEYILIIAATILVLNAIGIPRGVPYSLCLFAVNLALGVFFVYWFDRGRLISPATRRVSKEELAKLRARTSSNVLLPSEE